MRTYKISHDRPFKTTHTTINDDLMITNYTVYCWKGTTLYLQWGRSTSFIQWLLFETNEEFFPWFILMYSPQNFESSPCLTIQMIKSLYFRHHETNSSRMKYRFKMKVLVYWIYVVSKFVILIASMREKYPTYFYILFAILLLELRGEDPATNWQMAITTAVMLNVFRSIRTYAVHALRNRTSWS
jgi:hypothetical protein